MGRSAKRSVALTVPTTLMLNTVSSCKGKSTDIAVLTERLQKRLRVFAIAADGSGLKDLSAQGLPVFVGQSGEQAAPMGIALYRRPKDGAIFAIVGRKDGPRNGYLWQYRLQDDGNGQVKAQKIREFGQFSGTGEIEAIAVDDELGYVYYADEGNGIHKWHADPDHPEAARELAHFGKEGFRADREGMAIYTLSRGQGLHRLHRSIKRETANTMSTVAKANLANLTTIRRGSESVSWRRRFYRWDRDFFGGPRPAIPKWPDGGHEQRRS